MVERVVESVGHGGQGGRGRCRGDVNVIKRKKIVKGWNNVRGDKI